ncbi:MAG: hypothetical protein ACFCUG_05470 [Thiotrichales bacterium]
MKQVNRVRHVLAWTMAALLAGCGGGAEIVLATLGFVAPIGGDFNEDGIPATPALDATGLAINIQIGTGWNQLYDEKFVIVGFYGLSDKKSRCTAFNGDVNGRSVVAYEDDDQNGVRGAQCFRGTFENESVLVLADGRRLLRNFPLDLTTGVWSDIRDSNRKFRFEQLLDPATPGSQGSFSGCELRGATVTAVQGVFTRSDVANAIFAGIDQLTIQRVAGDEIWSGAFVGNSGLRLTRGTQELLLERRAESASCGG